MGANPVEDIAVTTGTWALRLLLLTLALSPLAHFGGWHGLLRARRALGLSAFLYALLHVLSYLVFDQSFDWAAMGADLSRRPPLLAGLAAFVLLVPLAASSSRGIIQRLGIRRWRRLHQLAYLAASAAALHYFWIVKQDVSAPSIYALIVAALVILRLNPRSTQPALKSGGARRQKPAL